MIEAVKYHPDHFDKIRRRDVYAGFSAMKESISSLMAVKSCEALTLFDGDIVLAVFGYTFFHPKAIEFWGVTGEDIKTKPYEFHKFAKSLLRSVLVDLDLNRAQVLVKGDFTAGKRWAEVLGFVQESVMKKFGPNGEDYSMYVKVAL